MVLNHNILINMHTHALWNPWPLGFSLMKSSSMHTHMDWNQYHNNQCTHMWFQIRACLTVHTHMTEANQVGPDY